jgi:WhiB family redox-sensing transcriptional regulator
MRAPIMFESPNCLGTEPEAFFPGIGGNTETRAAKRTCASCLHMDECMEWGLRHEAHGIWGGLTAHERERLRRMRGISLDQPEIFLPPVNLRGVA